MTIELLNAFKKAMDEVRDAQRICAYCDEKLNSADALFAHIITNHKNNKQAKLDKWWLNEDRLYGIVSDHPDLPDGLEIRTSPVTWIETNIKLAQTRNTLYTLLEPAL